MTLNDSAYFVSITSKCYFKAFNKMDGLMLMNVAEWLPKPFAIETSNPSQVAENHDARLAAARIATLFPGSRRHSCNRWRNY